MKPILFFLLFSLLSTVISGQDDYDFTAGKKSLNISKISEKITIDGVLDESVWKTIEKHGDFYEQSPLDGISASKVTEVQISYDDNSLYIGATLYDDNKYIINTLKRDNFGYEDAFAVVLDPQNQKSNGFAFGVNVLNDVLFVS